MAVFVENAGYDLGHTTDGGELGFASEFDVGVRGVTGTPTEACDARHGGERMLVGKKD